MEVSKKVVLVFAGSILALLIVPSIAIAGQVGSVSTDPEPQSITELKEDADREVSVDKKCRKRGCSDDRRR